MGGIECGNTAENQVLIPQDLSCALAPRSQSSLTSYKSVLLCSMSTLPSHQVNPAQALASVDQDRLVRPLGQLGHRDSAIM